MTHLKALEKEQRTQKSNQNKEINIKRIQTIKTKNWWFEKLKFSTREKAQ